MSQLRRRLCLFVLLFVLLHGSYTTQAQAWVLAGHSIDNAATGSPRLPNNTYSNATDLAQALRQWVPELQAQGYLAASIDSVAINGNRYDIYYYTGPQYRWASLLLDSVAPELLIAANISAGQYDGKALRPNAIAALSEKILRHCEDNGYPFAQVWLSDVAEAAPHSITARLRVQRAELRHIDTIILNGNVVISPDFLHRHLDIAKGSVYSEQKLRSIDQRLAELGFVQQSAPWVLSFRPGHTRLALFLKEKNANQLNALLGLMPNNLQSGKLLVTADVQLALLNKLGHGESISASYQNLQPKSPRIKADFVLPYVLKSAVGTEFHFDLFSNGLQFRKVMGQMGLRYQLSGSEYVRLYYQILSNRIIEVDTAGILATRRLPPNIDTRANGVGFELQSNRTDNKLNPHKGWLGKVGFVAFRRQVLPNNAVSGLQDGTGFDFGSLYDTVAKTSYQYHLNADVAGFIPLGKIFTLKLGYLGAYLASPQVFRNELYQIGGFRILRGFDEQSIFANQYHVGIAELRVGFGGNSYAYLFSDNGWVETKYNDYNRRGLYNGFGVGTTLETKTGLFSIALAFGRSDYHPLRFRESKVSFGYVALF